MVAEDVGMQMQRRRRSKGVEVFGGENLVFEMWVDLY
jgi:hypothetical protein